MFVCIYMCVCKCVCDREYVCFSAFTLTKMLISCNLAKTIEIESLSHALTLSSLLHTYTLSLYLTPTLSLPFIFSLSSLRLKLSLFYSLSAQKQIRLVYEILFFFFISPLNCQTESFFVNACRSIRNQQHVCLRKYICVHCCASTMLNILKKMWKRTRIYISYEWQGIDIFTANKKLFTLCFKRWTETRNIMICICVILLSSNVLLTNVQEKKKLPWHKTIKFYII